MNTGTEELELSQLRVPPHSRDAEMSLIGALLLDNSALERVEVNITAGDFYLYEHRLIYKAITDLLGKGEPADVVSVGELLKNNPEVGGLPRLNHLAQFVPSAANIKRYAKIIQDKSQLRRLMTASTENIDEIFDGANKEAGEILDRAERRILEIGENGARQEVKVKSNDEQIDELLEWMAEGSSSTGVRTGFDEIDEATNGLQPGELIVVAGRPSMGKTSFAFNIGEHAAYKQKLNVLAISMEMKSLQLSKKRAGSVARIRQESIKRPENMTSDEVNRFMEAMESMRGHVFDVVDCIDNTIESLVAIARRSAKHHKKIDLILIDYIQLMSTKSKRGGGNENRAGELGQISSRLKALAGELNCPVVVLSQLNRDVEKRPNKRPLMSDLKDSGSIEQDADLIMLLYRDDYYTKDQSTEPGIAEVNIAKQRMGDTGVARLAWSREYARFDNLAH
jgi:replicative DNA helicase